MEDGSDSARLKASLRELLRERRKLADGDDDNFNIFDTQQLAETLSSTMGVLTALLGAVAAVSLLVGGIGIMNIMLVSVTERTREIGLRLAVGALEGEVLLQFLIEAVVLSALGGVIGIAIATGASWGRARAMACPMSSTRHQPAGARWCSRRPSAWCSATSRRGARADGPDRGAAPRVFVNNQGQIDQATTIARAAEGASSVKNELMIKQ
jgi:ABC-type antimicrobial peptide transport system permease subunit